MAEKDKPTSARSKSLAPEEPLTKAEQEAAEEAEPIQAPLIADEDMPPVVEAEPIQNGRIAATYVGMSLDRDKEDEKLVHLIFSFKVTRDHEELIPDKFFKAYKWLLSSDNKSVGIDNVDDQTIDVYTKPDGKKEALHLSVAKIVSAKTEAIEENGKGKTKHVVRCKFSAVIERSEKAIAFAAWRDGESFWLTIVQSQDSIK
jgi:hypothetical protein